MKNRPVLFLALGLLVFIIRSSNFRELTVSDALLALAITAASLGPLVRWILKGMEGLPLFEFFCFFHFPYYAYPVLAAKQKFMVYGENDRWYAEAVILLFLVSANAAYYYQKITFRPSLVRRRESIWERELSLEKHRTGFALLLFVWATISLINALGYGSLFGTFLNVARSVASPGGGVALFYFYHNIGLRKLSKGASIWISLVVALVIICEISTGFLVGGGIYLIVALLGYTLARKRIPVLLVAIIAIGFQFLHLGKGDMRNEFWGSESLRTSTGISRVVEVYDHWLGASWERLWSRDPEEDKASIFDRANLIQMVTLVVHDTPAVRPFLKGLTYRQIPILLVPRFLWADKPRGSLPTETMGIYYELQDEESVNFTSIGFGTIAEAWANFGWGGVISVGALFGWLSAIGTGLSRGFSTSSIGFLTGVVFLAYTFQLEQSLGPYFVSMAQSLLFCVLAFLVMSRRTDHGSRRVNPATILNPPAPRTVPMGDGSDPIVNADRDNVNLSGFRERRTRVDRSRLNLKDKPDTNPSPSPNPPVN